MSSRAGTRAQQRQIAVIWLALTCAIGTRGGSLFDSVKPTADAIVSEQVANLEELPIDKRDFLKPLTVTDEERVKLHCGNDAAHCQLLIQMSTFKFSLQDIFAARDGAPAAMAHMPSQAELQTLFSGKRVAIVAPGSDLEGSKHGKDIDAHDLVVRVQHLGAYDEVPITQKDIAAGLADVQKLVESDAANLQMWAEYSKSEGVPPVANEQLYSFSLFPSPKPGVTASVPPVPKGFENRPPMIEGAAGKEDVGSRNDVVVTCADPLWCIPVVKRASNQPHLKPKLWWFLECCKAPYGLAYITQTGLMQATTHHPTFYFRQAYGLWDMDKPLPESEQQLSQQGRHGMPTTGFLVIMALKGLLRQGIIKEINLYGFQGQAHYSGMLRGAGQSCVTKGTNTIHNFDFEHSLLRKMHAQGELTLVDGLKLPKLGYC